MITNLYCVRLVCTLNIGNFDNGGQKKREVFYKNKRKESVVFTNAVNFSFFFFNDNYIQPHYLTKFNRKLPHCHYFLRGMKHSESFAQLLIAYQTALLFTCK